MQTITIAGKLARDAELRSTQHGDSVCSFTVAVDQREGREKTTNWWRVSLWGKRGDALAPYLLKGASVTVTGHSRWANTMGSRSLTFAPMRLPCRVVAAAERTRLANRSAIAASSTGNRWTMTQSHF